MKKIIAIALAVIMTLTLVACGTSTNSNTTGDTTSSTNNNSDSDNFEDQGYRIAYIIGSTPSEVFTLQNNAAKEEAESLGMSIDFFFSNGDASTLQDYVSQCANQGYDAIYIHGGSETFAQDMVQPLLDKGIKVICMEFKCRDDDGNVLEGVTEMMQDDQQMSDALCDYAANVLFKDKETINVVELYADVGFDPFVRRKAAVDEYVESGRFNVIATIGPTDSSNMTDSIMTNTAAILPTLGDQIDFIWSSYDAMAVGAYLACRDANMSIPILTVDVSNEDLQHMLEDGSCFMACASPAPESIGQQAVRILAMKLHGDETEETYMLSASLILQSDLEEGASVTTLADMVDGYGVSTDHYPDWMQEVKDRVASK